MSPVSPTMPVEIRCTNREGEAPAEPLLPSRDYEPGFTNNACRDPVHE